MTGYIIGIDQSTQGTKALLFDDKANLIDRADLSHRQIISKEGYISHDPEEIFENVLTVTRIVLEKNGVAPGEVKGIGISNQRETTVMWNRETKRPVCDAIVWQCARAESVCLEFDPEARTMVKERTGIPLSPYFPAAKIRWILKNCRGVEQLLERGSLMAGTMDSWLLFRLTKGKVHKTDYSNASRTQLFNLHTLTWDEDVCSLFGIPVSCLPKVCDSNACFGETDMDGLFPHPVPVHAVLGDSHGALFGQGCHQKGQVKATYGTGSSLMMNTGEELVTSNHGIVTSLAWGMDGKVTYVLEGNLNYTGAVITWLKDDLGLIASARETMDLALLANQQDTTYLVPAFSGLGAPYWKSEAKAMLFGMSRTTGKKEIVRAALCCIAYQITDILKAMEQDSGIQIYRLCVDGGPTGNLYLMQFQSDISGSVVAVPGAEELSGMGAAYMAGITIGLFTKEQAFSNLEYREYLPALNRKKKEELYQGWLQAVKKVVEESK